MTATEPVDGLDRIESHVWTLPIHQDVLEPFHSNHTVRAKFVADLFDQYIGLMRRGVPCPPQSRPA